MHTFQQDIQEVVTMIKEYPGSKISYDLFWAKGSGTPIWKQRGWGNSSDRDAIQNEIDETIEIYSPDAIKIHVVPSLKKHKAKDHIIDITGNLELENSPNPQRSMRNNRNEMVGNAGEGLSGGLGALQISNLTKDFDIKRLQDKLEAKTEKYKELEDDYYALADELEKTNAALGEVSGNNSQEDMMKMGAVILGKKLMGDDVEISELLGAFGGSSNNSDSAEETTEKKGGISFDEDEEDQEPKPGDQIALWLNAIHEQDNDKFMKLVSILKKFEEEPESIDTVAELIFE